MQRIEAWLMDKSLRYDRWTINDYLANTLRMSKTRRRSLETQCNKQGRRTFRIRTKQETRPHAHHTHAQENEEEAQRARQQLFTRARSLSVGYLESISFHINSCRLVIAFHKVWWKSATMENMRKPRWGKKRHCFPSFCLIISHHSLVCSPHVLFFQQAKSFWMHVTLVRRIFYFACCSFTKIS